MKKLLFIIGITAICISGLRAQLVADSPDVEEIKYAGSRDLGSIFLTPWVNPDDSAVFGMVYMQHSRSKGAQRPTVIMISEDGKKIRRAPYDIKFRSHGKEMETDPFAALNVDLNDDGPVSFTGDYRTMVFAHSGYFRSKKGRKNQRSYGLYFTEFSNGKWIRRKAFDHNERNAWLTSPHLSSDGQTLYFASNREGGYGAFDLYMSRKTGDSWSEPENLGPEINTAGNELSPFFHEESATLYFSSKGHEERARSYDIYESRLSGSGSFERPVKLSSTFNSRYDDKQIWWSKDKKDFFITKYRGAESSKAASLTFNVQLPEFIEPELRNAKSVLPLYQEYRIYDEKLDSLRPDLFDYFWVINDTLRIEGHDITYAFPDRDADYVARLNIYDKQMDSVRQSVAVTTIKVDQQEQAHIACPDTVRVNQVVEFDGSASFVSLDEHEEIKNLRYMWVFDTRGSMLSGKKVRHSYSEPGKYWIFLEIQGQRRGSFKEDDHTARLFGKLGGDAEVEDAPEQMTSSYKKIIVLPEDQ